MIVARIIRLWRFFNCFLHARKVWHWPRQSDVLIYDSEGHENLLADLRPWNPEILHIRFEQVNILVLIASLFRKGRGSVAYVDCYIERVRPKLIATFIDTNSIFFSISQRHPEVKTLFVQNGWRGHQGELFEYLDKLDDSRRNMLKVDYMLSFGSVSGNEYARHIRGEVIPVGSIRNNRIPNNKKKQRGIVAFISQWGNEGVLFSNKYYSQEEFFIATMCPIIQFLVDYTEKNGKRFVIIPRHPLSSSLRSAEEACYRRLAGHACEFLEFKGSYSSYKAIDVADVIVSIDSTLGYESLARGNKTAMFSIRGSVLSISGADYGWPGDFPDEGPYWANRPDTESFTRILDYLFEVDDKQWQMDIERTNFHQLMTYDPGNTIFKSTLESILEKKAGSSTLPMS